MTVKTILNRKGYGVVGIEREATLGDAARVLSEHRIGVVIVTEHGERIAGLLSERDIVRTIAARGAAALDEPVAAVMTRRVVTCSENDSTGELMERMTAGRFRHLPVVDGERMIGIVSIGDVVKKRIEDVEREAEEIRNYIATA